MGKGSRLRAKGKEIKFETEDGIKTYLLRPIKNEQLMEVAELGDKKKGFEAAMLMAKYSINRDPKIENGTEEPFDDAEIKDMDSPFLIQIMKEAAKLNGLGDVFDFQQRGVGTSQPTDPKNPLEKDLDYLNKNPAKKV